MDNKQSKAFAAFRKALYGGDPLYVGTAEFITEMLLKKTTAFARACEILPLANGGDRKAQALWIHAPHDDFAQLAFFDCLQGETAAANEVLEAGRDLTRAHNLHRLVIGLNGHLSYGVGILTQTENKNTFDTCYNKLYYADFFAHIPAKKTLTAYRCSLSQARARMKNIDLDTSGYTVRAADFGNFKGECERMRRLCDETIGTTYLYSKTEENHFYELLRNLKVLLHEDNLLFLAYRGQEVGFLFWHPDYNGAVQAGKSVSALSFALSYWLRKKRIDTVKLNSIGVCEKHRGKGTLALLRAMDEKIGAKYACIETNFVWDGNEKSRLLNRSLLGGECRTFDVYEVPV